MKSHVAFIASCTLLASGVFTSMHVAAQHIQGYSSKVQAQVVLQTSVTSSGQNIVYPRTHYPQVTMLHVVIPPGKSTGWHLHPVPGYAYVLAGTLMVETKRDRMLFHKGDGFAESVNVLHNGKNLGSTPVELLVTFLGSVHKPFVVKSSLVRKN